MRTFAIGLSLIGLVLTVVPAFFVLSGAITWRLHTQLMFAGMILWFVSAPLWMNKEQTLEE